jgi:hypothetical protein
MSMQYSNMSYTAGRLDENVELRPSVQHPYPEPCAPLVRRRKRNKFGAWNSLWFNGDPESREQLRSKYQHNFKRYREAYRPDDEEAIRLLELGMKIFTKLESRLTFKHRLKPYVSSGRYSMDRLCQIFDDERSFVDIDIAVVCVDFEGSLDQKGLNEYGSASIDFALQEFASDEPVINTSTYTLVSDRGRQSLWGEVTRTTTELLPRYVRSDFEQFHTVGRKRELVLVCHGLGHDVRALDALGTSFEDLSVTGLVDTHELGREILGSSWSLENLLSILGISVTMHSLHTAGNDAHYTLQALFALMQRKCDSQLGGIDKLVRRPAPRIRHWVTPLSERKDDWESNLDGNLWAALS